LPGESFGALSPRTPQWVTGAEQSSEKLTKALQESHSKHETAHNPASCSLHAQPPHL
jgi:hypothetical protein